MLSIIKRYLFVVCIFLFGACKKNETPAPDSKRSLTTDKTTLSLQNKIGSIDSFTIQYVGAWKITINPSTVTWIKLSAYNGSGDTKVYITVQENNSTDTSKTALLILSSTVDDSEATQIVVSQTAERKWQQMAPFPGVGRRWATSFVIGNKFYVGLGTGIKDNAAQDLNDFYEYDLSTNVWLRKNDFPDTARSEATGFSINGVSYIAFGDHTTHCNLLCTGVQYRDIWKYDPAADAWSKIATFNNINETGWDYAPVLVGNSKAYIVGSFGLYEFDPASLQFSKVIPYPAGFIYIGASFAIGPKMYILTTTSDQITLLSKELYEYDLASKIWTKKADLPGNARRAAIGLAANGKGYVIAGESAKQVNANTYEYMGVNDAWEYDPGTDTWNQIEDYPGSKPFYAVGGTAGGTLIVGTGDSNIKPDWRSYLSEFFYY